MVGGMVAAEPSCANINKIDTFQTATIHILWCPFSIATKLTTYQRHKQHHKQRLYAVHFHAQSQRHILTYRGTSQVQMC